jgi:hypothetical protein
MVMDNMRRRCSTWLLLLGASVITSAGVAHHSFSATYDVSQETRIEGEVAQFLFRNPHSMVHVLAPDDNGEMHRWAIEWAGVNVLTGQGITRETLRIGDKVIVAGNPGRNPADHRMRMLSIERPIDAWKWKGTFE